MAEAVNENVVNLEDLGLIDLSDLVRMDEEWKDAIGWVARLHLLISVLIAVGALGRGVLFHWEDPASTGIWFCGALISVAGIGYLIRRAHGNTDQLIRDLGAIVAFSLWAVTLSVLILRGQLGDFYLLYLLPLITAGGYLGLPRGLIAGVASAAVYALVVCLTIPVTAAMGMSLVLRAALFIVAPALFGLISERHIFLLKALRGTQTQALQLTVKDSKTGLFSQRYLATRMKSEIARAERAHLPVSFLVVDVTALAKINREYGYDAGDRVLASLSALIRQILRATDVASRWGSDEFGILLYDAEAEGAHQVAERLAAQVVRQKFTDPASGREFAVEVAQGIAAYPAHTTDKTGNELVDCAYGALKSAKRQEREGKKIGVWSGA